MKKVLLSALIFLGALGGAKALNYQDVYIMANQLTDSLAVYGATGNLLTPTTITKASTYRDSCKLYLFESMPV